MNRTVTIKVMIRPKHQILFIFLLSLTTILHAQKKEQALHELNHLLINTVMDDLFNPTVASRIYVYPNIAFYECIRHDDSAFPKLSGKLNGLKQLPAPEKNNDHFISACFAFSFVAQNLVGSEFKITAWRKTFTDSISIFTDSLLLKKSIQHGKRIADSIIAWTQKDNYLKSRGMMRYVISNKPGAWQPTPNDYAAGLEPHWNTIRPLSLQSASQFSPKQKLVYSASRQSVFYKNVQQVYSIGKKLDSNQMKIALYWDDNPNVSVIEGHLNYFIHKISPGGHWIMIARQACMQKNISVVKASLVYALTATAIFDGFISCWDEKYKTNLIRPISVINQHIDENWRPFIQTPPFPEFTSGHAVVSNAAAAVLTSLLGENFSFTDETEIPFGQKPGTFKSFNAAAGESSMSRVYGGIHYPLTASISVLQGQAIGKHIIKKFYNPVLVKP